MLRKLLIYLFILTNLSAQVSTAFACEMTGQVAMEHCCCDGDGMTAPTSPSDDPCCRQISLVTAADGATADLGKSASQKSALDLDTLPLLAAAVAVLLPDVMETATAALLPDAVARSGTLTYLHTLRLRI